MTRGVDVAAARIHGWFRLAVAGRTEEECLERVRKVTTSYRSRRVSIEHPRGQYGLLREFIPGEPVSTIGVPAPAARAVRRRRRPDGLQPARRPPRPLRRIHRRRLAPRRHVRHPLRHRGPGDLRSGARGRRVWAPARACCWGRSPTRRSDGASRRSCWTPPGRWPA